MDTERIAWLKQPTRQRVLEAAEQWFADAGYDLARVDDIAATAQVSKSHLYYHFPSKAALLSGLIELRLAEFLTGKDETLGGLTPQSLQGDPSELTAVLSRIFTEVLQPRRRFIRIVLIEALKSSDAIEPVLAGLTAMLDDAIDRFAELGVPLDTTRAAPLLFHLGLVPALFAVALDTSTLGVDTDLTDLIGDLAVVEQSLVDMLTRRST